MGNQLWTQSGKLILINGKLCLQATCPCEPVSNCTQDCTDCSNGTPNVITAVISGVADDVCNCTDINGTYELNYVGNCTWSVTIDTGCWGSTVTLELITNGLGGWQADLIVDGEADGATWLALNGDPPFDCTESQTLTNVNSTGDCDFSGSSIAISALAC